MKAEKLKVRLGEIVGQALPLPGSGNTSERHRLLAKIAREDLGLAKLAEAHWDAMAILAEAGRTAAPRSLYGVWASEVPGKALRLEQRDGVQILTGKKPFCSGIGIIDCALVTVGIPDQYLVEVELRTNARYVEADLTLWESDAFRSTQTGALTFNETPLSHEAVIGGVNWYLTRPGFWHGACGPAACWAGGVAGLVDYALKSSREDPHTLAHLAAMQSNVWGMNALLDQAGREIDAAPDYVEGAHIRALRLRHLIEQMATDVLRRFARAYGPQPLAMNEEISRRYHEAELYLRQSHGERDLEALAHLIR